jgi:hypothetical protein
MDEPTLGVCIKLADSYKASLSRILDKSVCTQHLEEHEPHILIGEYILDNKTVLFTAGQCASKHTNYASVAVQDVLNRLTQDHDVSETYKEKQTLSKLRELLQSCFNSYKSDFRSRAHLFIKSHVRFQPDFIKYYCDCVTIEAVTQNQVHQDFMRDISSSVHMQLFDKLAKVLQADARHKKKTIRDTSAEWKNSDAYKLQSAKIAQSHLASMHVVGECRTLKEKLVKQLAQVSLVAKDKDNQRVAEFLCSMYEEHFGTMFVTLETYQAAMIGLGGACDQTMRKLVHDILTQWSTFAEHCNKDMSAVQARVSKHMSELETHAMHQWRTSSHYDSQLTFTQTDAGLDVEKLRSVWMRKHLSASEAEENMVLCLLENTLELQLQTYHSRVNQTLVDIASHTDLWMLLHIDIMPLINALKTLLVKRPVPPNNAAFNVHTIDEYHKNRDSAIQLDTAVYMLSVLRQVRSCSKFKDVTDLIKGQLNQLQMAPSYLEACNEMETVIQYVAHDTTKRCQAVIVKIKSEFVEDIGSVYNTLIKATSASDGQIRLEKRKIVIAFIASSQTKGRDWIDNVRPLSESIGPKDTVAKEDVARKEAIMQYCSGVWDELDKCIGNINLKEDADNTTDKEYEIKLYLRNALQDSRNLIKQLADANHNCVDLKTLLKTILTLTLLRSVYSTVYNRNL